MDSRKQIIYTDAARRRLEELFRQIEAGFEAEMRLRRSIPGDDLIEVTASDVDEWARSLRVADADRDDRRKAVRTLIIRAYILLGVLMAGVGLVYPHARQLASDPIRGLLVITGLGIAAIGYLMHAYLSTLERRDARRERALLRQTEEGTVPEESMTP